MHSDQPTGLLDSEIVVALEGISELDIRSCYHHSEQFAEVPEGVVPVEVEEGRSPEGHRSVEL